MGKIIEFPTNRMMEEYYIDEEFRIFYEEEEKFIIQEQSYLNQDENGFSRIIKRLFSFVTSL